MNPFIYSFSRMIMTMVFRILYRWRVVGAENIPPTGPVLVCSNHRSYWDPPLIGCTLTRRIHMMAKEELFRIPVLSWWITRLGVFPVRRGKGDLGSFRRALGYLKEGKVVGIFPEGRRVKEGEVEEGKAGVALLALKSRAPVVPLAIAGSMKPFSRVTVRIGKPIHLFEDGGPGGKGSGRDMAELVNSRIMGPIRELLQEGE